MRFMLILLLVTSLRGWAQEIIPPECSDFKSVKKTTFVVFNKQELMTLGRCTGVNLLKQGRGQELAQACGEVMEDRLNPLGVLSLSKAEAIKIGQCMGVIKYIHDYYHNEAIQSIGNASLADKNRVYQCRRDLEAVEILMAASNDLLNTRIEIRALLCSKKYGG